MDDDDPIADVPLPNAVQVIQTEPPSAANPRKTMNDARNQRRRELQKQRRLEEKRLLSLHAEQLTPQETRMLQNRMAEKAEKSAGAKQRWKQLAQEKKREIYDKEGANRRAEKEKLGIVARKKSVNKPMDPVAQIFKEDRKERKLIERKKRANERYRSLPEEERREINRRKTDAKTQKNREQKWREQENPATFPEFFVNDEGRVVDYAEMVPVEDPSAFDEYPADEGPAGQVYYYQQNANVT